MTIFNFLTTLTFGIKTKVNVVRLGYGVQHVFDKSEMESLDYLKDENMDYDFLFLDETISDIEIDNNTVILIYL